MFHIARIFRIDLRMIEYVCSIWDRRDCWGRCGDEVAVAGGGGGRRAAAAGAAGAEAGFER
jgi:hypothetical protein